MQRRRLSKGNGAVWVPPLQTRHVAGQYHIHRREAAKWGDGDLLGGLGPRLANRLYGLFLLRLLLLTLQLHPYALQLRARVLLLAVAARALILLGLLAPGARRGVVAAATTPVPTLRVNRCAGERARALAGHAGPWVAPPRAAVTARQEVATLLVAHGLLRRIAAGLQHLCCMPTHARARDERCAGRAVTQMTTVTRGLVATGQRALTRERTERGYGAAGLMRRQLGTATRTHECLRGPVAAGRARASVAQLITVVSAVESLSADGGAVVGRSVRVAPVGTALLPAVMPSTGQTRAAEPCATDIAHECARHLPLRKTTAARRIHFLRARGAIALVTPLPAAVTTA